MSTSHYKQRRSDALEREIQSTLPPTKVISSEKIHTLVNRLSQAPKRLPSLHPPRPSDETIHLGPESERAMPTYDPTRDEHLALFWARQQVLLAEQQQKRRLSPSTPRSQHRHIATGEALLTPLYRRPKPPQGSVQYPYGRPPNSARGAQRKSPPSPVTKRRNSDNRPRRWVAADADDDRPLETSAARAQPKVPAPPPKKAASPPPEQEEESAKEKTQSIAEPSPVSSPEKTSNRMSRSSSKTSSRKSRSKSLDSKSRSRSNSSSRGSSSHNHSRSSSFHGEVSPSKRRHTTIPEDEGKSPATNELPQTAEKESPWLRTQSIPSMELRNDPRSLSPGAHLPEATPTLTPAPDNYGDDDFEEEDA